MDQRRGIARRAGVLVLAAAVAAGCAIRQAPSPTLSPGRWQERSGRLLTARRIAVEIDWLPGCAPAEKTLGGVRVFLEAYAGPEDGVHLALDEEIREMPDGAPIERDRAISDAEARQLERRHRSLGPGNGSESVYLLFVPRRYDEAERRWTRGVAFSADAFAVIARDTIRDRAFLAIRGDEIERLVVQHELGHLLGLVTGDPHEVRAHCTNPACIMYPGLDLRAALAHWWKAFTGRLPDTLDVDCRRDLEILRARAAGELRETPAL